MTAVIVVIALMVAGLALIAVEILVVPGLGLAGILGAIGVIGASYAAYTSLPPTYAALTIVGGVATAAALFWLLPRTRTGQSMILRTQALGSSAREELALLAGREGTAITPLRPSGAVEIDDLAVDVVTDGKYVDAGTKVKVVRVEGSRVVVEPVTLSADA